MQGNFSGSQPANPDPRSGVHGPQELLVVLGLAQLVDQEFHGLDRVVVAQVLAQHPDLGQILALDQQVFLARART